MSGSERLPASALQHSRVKQAHVLQLTLRNTSVQQWPRVSILTLWQAMYQCSRQVWGKSMHGIFMFLSHAVARKG